MAAGLLVDYCKSALASKKRSYRPNCGSFFMCCVKGAVHCTVVLENYSGVLLVAIMVMEPFIFCSSPVCYDHVINLLFYEF